MRETWLVLAAIAVAFSMFACEEELEKGSISGNVKDDGKNLSGAFVLLLEEGKILAAEAPLSNASVTDSQGNYTILLVEPEVTYYVVAVKDEDGDVQYTPGVDPIGYYGRYNKETKQWIPSPVSVGSGEKKTGINVADMYIVPGGF